MAIDPVSRVLPTTPSGNDENKRDEQILARNRKSQMRKQAKREEIAEESRTFFEHSQEAQDKNTAESHADFLNKLRETQQRNYTALGADVLAEEAAVMDTFEFEQKYVTAQEVVNLLSTMDPGGIKKKQFEEIFESLMRVTDETEDEVLEAAVKDIGKNPALLYLLLLYLMERLKNEARLKRRFMERLKKYLEAFERNESAYLFAFFSGNELHGDVGSLDGAQFQIQHKYAENQAGYVNLDSLRQTLQFVRTALPDKELYKMIAFYLKLKSAELEKVKAPQISPEDREQLNRILREQKNFIVIHGLYEQVLTMFAQFKNEFSHFQESYGEAINQIIALLDQTNVKEDFFVTFEKLFSIQGTGTLPTVISQIKLIIEKVPSSVFSDDDKRGALVRTLRILLSQAHPVEKDRPSFLNKMPKRGGFKDRGV